MNTTDKKVNNRWQTSYNWGLRAEFQEINQILKGVQKEIRVGDFTTGISNTDKNAIESALKIRLHEYGKA